MGVDGNDSLYPLAIALVEKENSHHWSWFLQWLQKSLHLGSGENLTLMSDMQKGLVNAVSDVLPGAEHRFYARHIYANWSKKWRGNEFKKKFFSCAWSTYVDDFKDNLTRLGSLRKEAATDVVTYNVQCWPGLNFEFVIEEGTSYEYMRRNVDPQTHFPIPNEREVRLSRDCNSSTPTSLRSIQFQPKSHTVPPHSDLPFQPHGLQWRGEPCVTTSQLLSRLQSNKDKGKGAAN